MLFIQPKLYLNQQYLILLHLQDFLVILKLSLLRMMIHLKLMLRIEESFKLNYPKMLFYFSDKLLI